MEQSVKRFNLDGTQRIQAQRGEVFDFPMHAHSYCEMTLYTPFHGHLLVNGRRIDPVTPTAVLVTPNDLHRITVHGESASLFTKICFDPALLPAELLPDCAVFCQELEQNDLLHRLLEEIAAAREDIAYSTQLIATALLTLRRKGQTLLHAGNARSHSLVARAAALLHERFTHAPTLSATAESLRVTPQYLSKVFSRELGMGFSDYLTELRLHRAAELLRTTALPVTDVCFLCGYNNLSHFLRAFKRHFGVTPKVYRASASPLRPDQETLP